jgi:hypothetical protein
MVTGLRRHPHGRTPAPSCYAIHWASGWRSRQRRKLLEPGLVGGPTGGWVAARAASRWVRICGMTCSVLPIRDCQPHWQLARRWPRVARAAGLTVTLCPATCSLTEMVTAHLRSVGEGRTYPPGKPVTNLPAHVHACALSRSPWPRQGRAGADRSARRVRLGPWWSQRLVSDGRSAVRRATLQQKLPSSAGLLRSLHRVIAWHPGIRRL